MQGKQAVKSLKEQGGHQGGQSLSERSLMAASIRTGRVSPQQAVYRAANCPFLNIYPA